MENVEGGKEGAAEQPHLYDLPERACFTATLSQNSDMLTLSFRTAPEILPPTELMKENPCDQCSDNLRFHRRSRKASYQVLHFRLKQ